MKNRLSAAIYSIALALGLFAAPAAHAGIPVIDGANLVQTVMTAISGAATDISTAGSYATEVSQYATQISQYKTQLANMVEPFAQVWQDYNSAGSMFQNTLAQVQGTYTQLGNIGNYNNTFSGVSQFSSDPCFSGGACTPAMEAAHQAQIQQQSDNTMQTIKNNLTALQQQAAGLGSDASNLSTIQNSVTNSSGNEANQKNQAQLQALAAAQLMDMRAMMVQQQTAQAQTELITQQAQANQLAQTQARQAVGAAAPNPASMSYAGTYNSSLGISN